MMSIQLMNNLASNSKNMLKIKLIDVSFYTYEDLQWLEEINQTEQS